MTEYEQFIADKAQLDGGSGFAPIMDHPFLFDFQRALTDWSLRKGRAAIFADCGLGKTPIEFAWADNVVRKTNRPVLLLTPLAVAAQMLREAQKFGVDLARAEPGKRSARVEVVNYERLHHFNADDYAGVAAGEE